MFRKSTRNIFPKKKPLPPLEKITKNTINASKIRNNNNETLTRAQIINNADV